jgi:hypothetical protein
VNFGELDIVTSYPSWEYFATLTFRVNPKSAPRSRGAAMQFLFRVAKIVEVPFPRLIWCLREEHGEINGRRHFHALIGGTATHNISGSHRLKFGWESPGYGFADVKVFDQGQLGIEYVAGCLTNSDAIARQSYEARKLSLMTYPPTLSKSLLSFVRDRELRKDKRLRRMFPGVVINPESVKASPVGTHRRGHCLELRPGLRV